MAQCRVRLFSCFSGVEWGDEAAGFYCAGWWCDGCLAAGRCRSGGAEGRPHRNLGLRRTWRTVGQALSRWPAWLGYVDGRNAHIEFHSVDGRGDRAAEVAADYV